MAARKKAARAKAPRKKQTRKKGPAKDRLKRSFYTNMSWFDTVDNPEDISVLPPAFAEAKRLWQEDGEGNFEAIQKLLGHYVQGLFLPESISGAEQLFSDPFGESEATEVRVVGFDFSSGNIPTVSAEAWFEVEVVDGFDEIDLEQWQEENDFLYSAVSFGWDIDMDGREFEFDFTWQDHQGREATVIDKADFPSKANTDAIPHSEKAPKK